MFCEEKYAALFTSPIILLKGMEMTVVLVDGNMG